MEAKKNKETKTIICSIKETLTSPDWVTEEIESQLLGFRLGGRSIISQWVLACCCSAVPQSCARQHHHLKLENNVCHYSFSAQARGSELEILVSWGPWRTSSAVDCIGKLPTEILFWILACLLQASSSHPRLPVSHQLGDFNNQRQSIFSPPFCNERLHPIC
jgi:hypothetical protein